MILRLFLAEFVLYKFYHVSISSLIKRVIVINIDVAAIVDRVSAFELLILIWNLLLSGSGLATTRTHYTLCLHLFKYFPLVL